MRKVKSQFKPISVRISILLLRTKKLFSIYNLTAEYKLEQTELFRIKTFR